MNNVVRKLDRRLRAARVDTYDVIDVLVRGSKVPGDLRRLPDRIVAVLADRHYDESVAHLSYAIDRLRPTKRRLAAFGHDLDLVALEARRAELDAFSRRLSAVKLKEIRNRVRIDGDCVGTLSAVISAGHGDLVDESLLQEMAATHYGRLCVALEKRIRYYRPNADNARYAEFLRRLAVAKVQVAKRQSPNGYSAPAASTVS